MKKATVLILGLIMAVMPLGLLSGCGPQKKTDADIISESSVSETSEADKVIIGTVYTGNSENKYVEALAIKDGTIIYAGDKVGVQAYIGTDTEVTTLEPGQLVASGFIDAHNHASISWTAKLGAVMIPQGASAQECIDTISEYVAENPDKPYYLANGWMNSAFANGSPTADLLDVIDTDKPIIATSFDGHSVWCNTAALIFANITADTEPPAGGTIDKNADGTPSGCLHDNAIGLPSAALPAPTTDEIIQVLTKAQEEYASLGYTAYNEAMINEKSNLHAAPVLEAYEKMDREGKMLTYVQGSYITSNRDDYLELVDEAIKYHDETKGGNFEVTDVKIFMDGVVEGGTAYLSEPYANDATYYGVSSWKTDEDLAKLTEIVVKANSAGMPVHFHAIGDQASTNAVAVVQAAYEQIGDIVKDSRNIITHLQVVDEKTIEKMAELNMVATLNPWCCKAAGMYEELEVPALGEERAEKEYPVKSFMDKGVHTAFATDYGSSFVYDPIECYHVFVTRMEKDDNPATQLNADECITPRQALEMMSAGGAWQMHKEDTFGTLEIGKQANLTILSKNLFEIEDSDIMSTSVLGTMYNGRWVYTAE